MKPSQRAHAALAAIVAAALAAAGCGEKSEPEPQRPVAAPATTGASNTPSAKPDDDAPGGPTQAERRAARLRADERAVERTVTRYIEALDDRDGSAVCRLLEPGALDELKLPRERGGCAASLDASIGYRDPRGLPQFKGVHLSEVASIRVGRRNARATTSIVTSFADRTEPSFEDDIIYLARDGDGWLIAKPSSALYRAIGAEPGPEVIVPPG